MMTMRPIAFLFPLLLLAACASSEEIAAERDAIDHQECVELGFEPGTEAYGNCRLELRSIRAQEMAALTMSHRYSYRPYGWYHPWYRSPYDPYWW